MASALEMEEQVKVGRYKVNLCRRAVVRCTSGKEGEPRGKLWVLHKFATKGWRRGNIGLVPVRNEGWDWRRILPTIDVVWRLLWIE